MQVVESPSSRFLAHMGVSTEDLKGFPIRAMLYSERPDRLVSIDPEFVLALLRPGDLVYFVLNADDLRSYTNSLRFLGSKGLRSSAFKTK